MTIITEEFQRLMQNISDVFTPYQKMDTIFKPEVSELHDAVMEQLYEMAERIDVLASYSPVITGAEIEEIPSDD